MTSLRAGMITYVGREERERRTESKHNTQYFIQVRTICGVVFRSSYATQ
jgi:hypothetical protein